MKTQKPAILVLSSHDVSYTQALDIQKAAEENSSYAIIANRCYAKQQLRPMVEERIRDARVAEVWLYGSSPMPQDMKHLAIMANRAKIVVVSKDERISLDELT